ncbi:MAG: type I glyceraldehyde-3-phosphate dehydrogenase [Ardenticatenales bacterium]|jgi:glyceraldehyde 3-phosphate dehydrogenase|nr:type I glyceraldehyde-3-phosphate dehydrogenase [Ardenticatenales bacterium]
MTRKARVAIYGFGRTGRQAFKAIWERHRDRIEVAAIGLANPDDASAAAHLLQYDSNYGRFGPHVSVHDHTLHVDDVRVPFVSAERLADLPWRAHGIDIVIEATGQYEAGAEARGHVEAGAAHVVITAPSDDADCTLIYGVNEDHFDPAAHATVSSGSDTTNALAPVLMVLDASFPLKNAMLTAVRAYTNAQKLVDSTDQDLRRARSAPTSIVPTTTRAPKAIAHVLPGMAGKISGYAVRVPVPTVSFLEVTAQFEAPVSVDALNDAFRAAARGPLGRVLAVSDAPLVSTDFRGNPNSAIIDAPFTMAIGPLAKISAWYDNEYGYSNRVADVVAYIAARTIGTPRNGSGA